MKPWVWPLVLLIAFEACADILSERYALNPTATRWVFALAGYVVANVWWLLAMRRGVGLARGGVLFAVGSAVLAVAIGTLMYHEHLSPAQLVGIALGIAAIALLT